MEIRYRKATEADFDSINELFVEMLCTIYEKEKADGYKKSDMEYYFSGGEDWICVAESAGKIVGFLAIEVHREEREYLYYDDFSVSKAYRGCGIGGELMCRAEEYAKSLGISAIVLHVEKRNESARTFYEKRGFALLRDDGDRLCLLKHWEEDRVKSSRFS